MRWAVLLFAIVVCHGQARADDDISPGVRAAFAFGVASNGGESCGLIVDRPALYRRVLQDGMDRHVLGELRGQTPPPSSEARPDFQEQLEAWRKASLLGGQWRGDVRSFCQWVYDQFGPSGAAYPGILAKPSVPYSPNQLR